MSGMQVPEEPRAVNPGGKPQTQDFLAFADEVQALWRRLRQERAELCQVGNKERKCTPGEKGD